MQVRFAQPGVQRNERCEAPSPQLVLQRLMNEADKEGRYKESSHSLTLLFFLLPGVQVNKDKTACKIIKPLHS